MPPTRTCHPWMVVLLSTVAGSVHAQSPDTLDLWSATAEFGFGGASGNTSFSMLTASAQLNHLDRERFEFDLSGRYRYGTNDDRVIANDVEVTAKFDYHPQSNLSPFVFTTGGRDVIRNVDGRLLAGGGGKWTFWRPSDSTKMSVSGAVVVEHEDYRLEAGSTAAETNTVGRWSARLKFDHAFASGAKYQHVTFWQPRITRMGDYLVNVSNSLEATVFKGLSIEISHAYIHDEIPPPGAVRDDTRLEVTLKVDF